MFFINPDVESPDRFDLARFMDWKNDDVYDPLDSYFIRRQPELLARTQYAVQNAEHRPDMIAFRVYNNVNFWWLILLYNNLVYSEELEAGDVLILPSEEDISELYFRLKALETSNA